MTAPVDATPALRDLALPEPLLRATDDLGFTHCTAIQALTLPVIATGRDVAAQAHTGTGKTAAFLLGSFARLLGQAPREGRRPDQPRMLVIAPTRELAIQIANDAEALSAHTDLTTAVVYGGIDYEKQREQVAAGVDVLIGTPGRLIDYFKQKVFNLSALEIVVLDEADRMFDLGFIADIRFLLRRMPPPGERISMLFSATLSHRVMELAYEHMNKPEELKTETGQVTADGVRQLLYQPAQDEKISLLLGLIRDLQPPRSMVFVNTKRAAERIESYLVGNDIVCGLLSGDVRQNKRQKILADFTAGRIPVLIATDVAARGLHIDDVSHVFNYDLPQQAEDYVHRIGRTARAGSKGMAVSFACENYSFSLPEIQAFIGQSIPLEPITDELLVKPRPPARIERDRVEKPGERRGGAKRSGGAGKRRDGAHEQREPSKRSRPRSKPSALAAQASTVVAPTQVSTSVPAANASPSALPGAATDMRPVVGGTTTAGTGAAKDTAAPKKRRRRRRSRTRDTATAATPEGGESGTAGTTAVNAAADGDQGDAID